MPIKGYEKERPIARSVKREGAPQTRQAGILCRRPMIGPRPPWGRIRIPRRTEVALGHARTERMRTKPEWAGQNNSHSASSHRRLLNQE